MTATTIEQSRRLLELGIPASTADMCYIFTDMEGEQISGWEASDVEADGGEVTTTLKSKDDGSFDYSYVNDSPAWSLAALIRLLPVTIIPAGKELGLHINFIVDQNKVYTHVEYSNEQTKSESFVVNEDIFEALVLMVRLMKSEGYIHGTDCNK